MGNVCGDHSGLQADVPGGQIPHFADVAKLLAGGGGQQAHGQLVQWAVAGWRERERSVREIKISEREEAEEKGGIGGSRKGDGKEGSEEERENKHKRRLERRRQRSGKRGAAKETT